MAESEIIDDVSNDQSLAHLLDQDTIFMPKDKQVSTNDEVIDVNAPLILTTPNRTPMRLPAVSALRKQIIMPPAPPLLLASQMGPMMAVPVQQYQPSIMLPTSHMAVHSQAFAL